MKFENKLRDTIMYLIDRIDWPNFYTKLSKFASILNNLREDEATVREILDKSIKREYKLVVLCIEVIDLPFSSRIEDVFDMSLDLVHFDIEREIL